ncbi:MAG: hypothetical protein ACR2IV_21580 [Bryobacteraceae bacterium]
MCFLQTDFYFLDRRGISVGEVLGQELDIVDVEVVHKKLRKIRLSKQWIL